MKQIANLARIANWPFALKMGIGPALAMLALIGLAALGIHDAGQQARLVRDVVDQDLAWAEGLSASASHLQRINGRIYRLTTLQAARDPDLNVDREAADLIEQTTALSEELNTYALASASRTDHDELIGLIADIRLYRDMIGVVGSMLAIDFPSAVRMIKPFDDNARQVLASLETMTRRAVSNAEARARMSAGLAGRTRLTFATVAACMAVGLFSLAVLLTQATVRSVRQIADATWLVAKGDQTMDIGALERADELGTIVRSLSAFQANVAQVAFLAHHDPLTTLPNRILFRDRVFQALKTLDRGGRFALFFLDLDHFKAVNDSRPPTH